MTSQPEGGTAPVDPADAPAGAPVHPPADPLVAWTPDTVLASPPDPAAEPGGFLVTAAGGTRVHFLDWGSPASPDGGPGVLLVPGFLSPAWAWAPVARRLAAQRRVIVADLRGQGLSDAPPDGYDMASLGADVVAVAEGSGLLDGVGGAGVVLAGHGLGGAVAAEAAVLLGAAGRGLLLVDGGWERVEAVTDLDAAEFLRGLDEPPEVLRSIGAYLADRRAFDPATWDADQERAARDAVVETAAGHVVRAVRPHVIEALVAAMFAWDPAPVLARVQAPVAALVALGGGETETRVAELRRAAGTRLAAGHGPVGVAPFPGIGHNLPRYRPADVAAAILELGTPGALS